RDRHVVDLRYLLEPILDLDGEPVDLRHLGARDPNLRGRAAEQPREAAAATPAAVGATALPAAALPRREVHVADLYVRQTAGRAPHFLAHAPRRRGVARVLVQMHGDGAADLLEGALDELDARQIEHGLLDAREHGSGGVERRAAAELHLK